MNRRYVVLMVTIVVLLTGLACGLGGIGGGAAPTPEPTADTALPADQPDAAPTTAQEDAPAEPTEAPAAPPPAAEGDFEEAAIDSALAAALEGLNSYRSELTMAFDGQSSGEPVQGTVSVTIEATRDPAAKHFTLDAQGMEMEDVDGPFQMEVYIVEDTVYLNSPLADGWVSFPGGDDSTFTEGFFTPQDIVDLPTQAKRKLLPETVNGILSWHYVFDESNLSDAETIYDDAQGDAWIAVDGGYLVKMEFTAKGRAVNPDPDANLFDEGNMQISYDLTDVNGNIVITLPEEAASATDAGALFGGAAGGEWTREDIPLPEDAEIQFSMEGLVQLTTGLDIEAASAFMQSQLEANGWAISGEPFITETGAFVDFEKDGEKISLIIGEDTEGSGRTSIFITVE